MNTAVWLIAIVALFIAITISAIVAWKHTRPTITPIKHDPNADGDISIDDAMRYLKLTNLK